MPVPPRSGPPLVIAHRGASALLPEHTLAAYARAIADGADVVEPDLVCTRDGVLVARHEDEIGGTTDVARHPEFADRHATRTIDGKAVTGWFASDFTVAEMKTLRARERLPHLRSTAHDGQFEVPTWDEIVALVAACGRRVGLMPEVKHPSYFRARGLALEERLLERLDAHPYTRDAPVVIQSFETGNLRRLRAPLASRAYVRLMQVLGAPHRAPFDAGIDGEPERTYADWMTADALREIAAYADIVSPPARAIIPVDAAGNLTPPTDFVADAHAAGLEVMPYTFRPENHFLPRALWLGDDPATVNAAGSITEMRAVLAAGVDGLFTDDPALGRAAVDGFA
jgi:glycerophosphoryl diester phosphodiesterase